MMRWHGKDAVSCPVCGQMHSQVSIKHHLRSCARKFLANLATCPHCARPCQKEDLPEHQRRCAKQRQAEESNLLRKQLGKNVNDGSRGGVPPTASLRTFVDSKEQQLEAREQEQLEKAKQALLWKQRMADIKNAFIALERGELGLPDKLGRFACGVCGEKFRLQAIVPHEKKCRERLATDGKFGGQNCPSTAAPSSESETESVAEKEKENRESSRSFETLLAALRSEIYLSVRDDVHVENSSDEPAEDAWRLAVERLKAVIANATTPRGEEKKFRRLKKKNEAFHHALGRWTKAVEIMKTELGFVETTAAASAAAGAGCVRPLRDEFKAGAASKKTAAIASNTECQANANDILVRAAAFSQEKSGELISAIDSVAKRLEEKDEVVCPPAAAGDANGEATCSDQNFGLLEECKYCSRKFRFDRIAKHETRCSSAKPKVKKFDYVAHFLRNTPAENHISEIKRNVGKIAREGLPKLNVGTAVDPVLGRNPRLMECPRCLRCFNTDSYEKHVKRCKATQPAAVMIKRMDAQKEARSSIVVQRGGAAAPSPAPPAASSSLSVSMSSSSSSSSTVLVLESSTSVQPGSASSRTRGGRTSSRLLSSSMSAATAGASQGGFQDLPLGNTSCIGVLEEHPVPIALGGFPGGEEQLLLPDGSATCSTSVIRSARGASVAGARNHSRAGRRPSTAGATRGRDLPHSDSTGDVEMSARRDAHSLSSSMSRPSSASRYSRTKAGGPTTPNKAGSSSRSSVLMMDPEKLKFEPAPTSRKSYSAIKPAVPTLNRSGGRKSAGSLQQNFREEHDYAATEDFIAAANRHVGLPPENKYAANYCFSGTETATSRPRGSIRAQHEEQEHANVGTNTFIPRTTGPGPGGASRLAGPPPPPVHQEVFVDADDFEQEVLVEDFLDSDALETEIPASFVF